MTVRELLELIEEKHKLYPELLDYNINVQRQPLTADIPYEYVNIVDGQLEIAYR